MERGNRRDDETSFSSSDVGSSDLSDCEGESSVSTSDDGGWVLKSAPRRERESSSPSPAGVVPVPDALTPVPIRQSAIESSPSREPEDVWVVESIKPITRIVEWMPPKRHTTPVKDRGYLNPTAAHDIRKTTIQQHQRTNSPASHKAGSLKFGGWHPAPNNTSKVPVVGGTSGGPVVRLTRTQILQSNSRTNTPVRRAPPPPVSQARVRTQTPTRATPNRTPGTLRTASPAAVTPAASNRTQSPGVGTRGSVQKSVKSENVTPTSRGRTNFLTARRVQSPAAKKVARSLTDDLADTTTTITSQRVTRTIESDSTIVTRKDSITQPRRHSKQSQLTDDLQTDQPKRTTRMGVQRTEVVRTSTSTSISKVTHDVTLDEPKSPKTPKQIINAPQNVCFTNTITKSQNAQEPSPSTPRTAGIGKSDGRTGTPTATITTPEIPSSPATPHRLSNTVVNKRYNNSVVENSKLVQMLNKKEAAAAARSAAVVINTAQLQDIKLDRSAIDEAKKRRKSRDSTSSLTESENSIPDSESNHMEEVPETTTLHDEIMSFLVEDEQQSRVNIFEDEFRIRSSILIMSGNIIAAYSPPRTKTPARKYVRPEPSAGARLPPVPTQYAQYEPDYGYQTSGSERSLSPRLAWNHRSESPTENYSHPYDSYVPPANLTRSGYTSNRNNNINTNTNYNNQIHNRSVPSSVDFEQVDQPNNLRERSSHNDTHSKSDNSDNNNLQKSNTESTDDSESTKQPSRTYSGASSQSDDSCERKSVTYTLSDDNVPIVAKANCQLSNDGSSPPSSESTATAQLDTESTDSVGSGLDNIPQQVVVEHNLAQLEDVVPQNVRKNTLEVPMVDLPPRSPRQVHQPMPVVDDTTSQPEGGSECSYQQVSRLRLSPHRDLDSSFDSKPPRSPRRQQSPRIDDDSASLDTCNSNLPQRGCRINSPRVGGNELPLRRHPSYDEETSECNFHRSRKSDSTASLPDNSPERDFQGIVMESPSNGDFYNLNNFNQNGSTLTQLLDEPDNEASHSELNSELNKSITRLLLKYEKKRLELTKDESQTRRRLVKNIAIDPELGGDTAMVSSPVFARRQRELQEEQDREVDSLIERHNLLLSQEQDFLLSVEEDGEEAVLCRTRIREISTAHYSNLAILRSNHAKAQAKLWSQPSPNFRYHQLILKAVDEAESDHTRLIAELDEQLQDLDLQFDDLSIGDSSITVSVSDTPTANSIDDSITDNSDQEQKVVQQDVDNVDDNFDVDELVQSRSQLNVEQSDVPSTENDDCDLMYSNRDPETESILSSKSSMVSSKSEPNYKTGRKAIHPNEKPSPDKEDLPQPRNSLLEFKDDYLNQQFSNISEIEFYNRKVLSEEESTCIASVFNMMHSCLLQLVLNRHKRHPSASASSSTVSSQREDVAKEEGSGSPLLSQTIPQRVNFVGEQRSVSPAGYSTASSWVSRESSTSPSQSRNVRASKFSVSRSPRRTPSPNHSVTALPSSHTLQGTRRSFDSGSPRFSVSPSDVSRSPSTGSSIKPQRRPPPPPSEGSRRNSVNSTSPKRDDTPSNYGNLDNIEYGTIGIRGKLPRRKSVTSDQRPTTIVVRSPSVEEVLEQAVSEQEQDDKITPPAQMAEYALPMSTITPDTSDHEDDDPSTQIELPKHTEPKWKQIIDNLHASTGPVRQIFDRMQKEQSKDRTAHRNNLISRLRNELKEAADKDREPLAVAPSTALLNTFRHRQVLTKGMRRPRSMASQMTSQTGASSIASGFPVWTTGPGFRGSGDLGYCARSPSPPIQEKAFTRSSASRP
eukprot:TRINITY_DN7555_c10_g1_i1.p1 TRINITY_DN7555_c10_g1~~TRINITY_DN7555_c10_g1_i1.p1  ORF type:complete len:1785 (+),score=359.63 TRINITY_DN7555_c10_g1_i1:3296-8650(+)